MIEKLAKKDYDQIVSLGKILKPEYSVSYIGENETVYVFKEDNKIKGFIQVMFLYDTLEIIDIVVDLPSRREKIATNLLNFVIDYYKPVHTLLEVNENNIEAISLYKKFNFQTIRVIDNYYENAKAYVMERK